MSLTRRRIRERLSRAAPGDGAALAGGIHRLDDEMIAGRNPDSGGALIGREYAEELHHLPIEIQSHQSFSLAIESSHRLGVIHDAALQGQRGLGRKAAHERPDRPHQQGLEGEPSQQGNADLNDAGEMLLEEESGRAEADQETEPDPGGEKQGPGGARGLVTMRGADGTVGRSRMAAAVVPAAVVPADVVSAGMP